MRLLYLTEYFHPPAEGGLMRTWELSRHLTLAGHSVSVVVPGAHHMTGEMPEQLRGRFAYSYLIEGIEVTKVWVWSRFRRSALDRIAYYLSTAFSCWAAALFKPADVVMGSIPPFFLAPATYLLARLRRVPFVLEFRDAWLEFAIAKGLVPRFAVPALEAQQRWLMRQADRIVAVTPGLAELAKAALPEDQRQKVVLVMNGYEDDVFAAADPARVTEIAEEWELGERFVAIYTGTMGLARDCMTFMRAADRLRGEEEIVFVFVGEGEQKREMEEFARSKRLRNCIFVPMQPRADMPAWLALSQVGLNSIRGGENLESSLSNKIFDYMGAGLPVVWSGAGDTTEFIEVSGGGIAVGPEDDEAMAGAILDLKRHPKRRRDLASRGQHYVIDNYSRSKLVGRLERMLVELVGQPA